MCLPSIKNVTSATPVAVSAATSLQIFIFFGLVLMFVQIKPNANKSISNETRSEINVLQNKYDKINVFATERVASNKINWCRRISRMCDVVLIKIHGHESCEASLWNVWKALVALDVWVYGCACVCVCECGTFSISKGVLFIFSFFPCVFTFNVIYLRFSCPPKLLRSFLLCNPSSLSHRPLL